MKIWLWKNSRWFKSVARLVDLLFMANGFLLDNDVRHACDAVLLTDFAIDLGSQIFVKYRALHSRFNMSMLADTACILLLWGLLFVECGYADANDLVSAAS